MKWTPRLVCVLAGAAVALVALGGERNPIEELNPRPIKFTAAQLPLADALAELQKQSGNVVKDVRINPSNPTVTLPRSPATFWQALDAIGKDTGIAFSPYQPNGDVALMDRAYREVKTDSNGVFRVGFNRISVSRDEDTGMHLCHATFDVAWEPRIRLMHVNLEKAKVSSRANKSEDLPGQPAVNVSRASATEFELRMSAPPRAVQKIDSISGSLRAVGAPKVLEFKFAKPAKSMTQKLDGVTVKATVGTQTDERWSITLEVEHPQGALVDVQSFQGPDLRNFLYYRVWLSWNKNRIELQPTGEASKGAGIEYHFEAAKSPVPLPPKDADVTLHFRTPNRVVAFTVPFAFRDLPLP